MVSGSDVVPSCFVSSPTFKKGMLRSSSILPRSSSADTSSLTFEQWSSLYGKTYRSSEESLKAKQTFEQNVKLVSDLNELYKEK